MITSQLIHQTTLLDTLDNDKVGLLPVYLMVEVIFR